MSIRIRTAMAATLAASAVTIAAGGWPLLAQDAGKANAEPRARVGKRTVDPSRRVPFFFGQLGLSDAQKESIYQIQARHRPRIEALEKQLEEIRAQSLKECEAVLTDTQKKLLEDRRAGAAEPRTKKAAAASTARPQG